jgi:hypothetical protein
MPEQIAMTPPDRDGNQVFWESHSVGGRQILVPSAGTLGYGLYLASVANSESYNKLGLDFVLEGEGADTYRANNLNIFLIKSITGPEDPKPTWLEANLIAADVIRRGQRDFGELIGVTKSKLKLKTPEYLASVSCSHLFHPEMSVQMVISQDVSIGRIELGEDNPDCVSIEDDVHEIIKFLVSNYYPDIELHIDAGCPNLFIGNTDIAKIDCDSISSPTLD